MSVFVYIYILLHRETDLHAHPSSIRSWVSRPESRIRHARTTEMSINNWDALPMVLVRFLGNTHELLVIIRVTGPSVHRMETETSGARMEPERRQAQTRRPEFRLICNI
jgi:hypothetical protein